MWLLIVLLIVIIIYNNRNIIKKLVYKESQETTTKTDLDKYIANGYIMTQTELKFYRELKKVTDKLELTIFSQVGLERIINVIDNNNKDRNRIKSRTIDFAVVNNKNCKIVCCIELDDYTHNREKSKKADAFKDSLFKQVNIPLHRIKVNNYYNLEQLENIIKESCKPPISVENNL